MPQKMLIANWKMHGQASAVQDWVSIVDKACNPDVTIVLIPPVIYLPQLAQSAPKHVLWGAQNAHAAQQGAFTGEISLDMLSEYGCRYVLVGHSERRRLFHEDEKCVAEKFHRVKEHDMIPVLCIGETWEEREQGLTTAVLEAQLSSVYDGDNTAFEQIVVAYEPVWAIGTGQTPSPETAQTVHSWIRQWIGERNAAAAASLSILYGGSLNSKNAQSFFLMPDIDGGLVGGASLHAQSFLEMVQCII